MPRAITASKALEMPDRTLLARGMGSLVYARTNSPAVLARYGGVPVRHSYKTYANAYTSAR